ncbi:MAG: serine/threonine-protein kinase [Gammaproteobacteria bacterium]|nr:serine/threonine-protein kinase [Gammaproteobacteria bacterium]
MANALDFNDLLEPGGGLSIFQKILETPRGRLTGQVIGSYGVGELRATGGMGEVYLGRRIDGRFHRDVAIKVSGAGSLGDEMRQRFIIEQSLLAEFNHPNIAHLYDAGITEEGVPYIVMEFIDGEPIDLYCQSRGLKAQEIVAMMSRVCEAVAYSHARMVVHRDIKPSNILIDSAGHPKLVDFGIAKYLGSGFNETIGATPMTPRYASPEQLRGDTITISSDVYQIGLVMFELLCGSPFREGSSAGTSIRRALADKPGDFRPLHQRKLPRDLARIVEQALRNAPSDRYQSALALRDDLENFLNGRPVRAVGNDPLYRLKKFVARNLPLTSVATAAVILLSAATIWYVTSIARARDTAQQQALLAQHEAAAARKAESERAATVDLFRQVFTTFNADSRPLGEISAEELLTTGAQRALDDLPDNSVVQARALREFARIYAVLDKDSMALDLLDRIHVAGLSSEPLLLDDIDSALSTLHSRAGRYEKAVRINQQRWNRLASAEEAPPEQYDGRRLNVAVSLANDLRSLGRRNEAEGWLLRALEFDGALSASPREHVWALRSLAILRDEQRRYDLAAAAYGDAVSVAEERLGDDDAMTGAVYQSLGVHHEWQNQFAEARDYYVKALAVIRRVYGTSSRRYGDYLVGVANMEGRLGNPDRAAALMAESIGVLEEVQGSDSHLLAEPLSSLAAFRRETGDLQGARALYERAIEIVRDPAEQTGGPVILIKAYVGLAATERLASQLGRAEEVAESALAHALRYLPEDSVDLVRIYAELAIQAWLRDDSESAKASWDKLDDIAVTFPELGDLALRTALETYFRYLRESSRSDELDRIAGANPVYAKVIDSL